MSDDFDAIIVGAGHNGAKRVIRAPARRNHVGALIITFLRD